MCGIYGSTKLYDDSIVRKKLDSISFRGPDFSDFKKISDKCILGHNRLAIIDLDPRSNQPFTYEHLTLVFNGEIYNFQKIKSLLQSEGYKFRTTSDSEVICAAYLHYGKKCVDHFNGMFAFVIYNHKTNTLWGARDRLGQKPFYYSLENDQFEFASQIYPISIGNNFTLDHEAVRKYFLWKTIPGTNSIYKEIRKLKAGNSFEYDLNTKKFSTSKYWDIDEYSSYNGSYDEAKSELKNIIEDAVKIRLISDVQLGVFLSGGIDSSLVASMAQSISTDPIKTFSVKFDEAKYDESGYASQVAKVLKTDHSIIKCNYNEGIEMIENLPKYYQEPFADSSSIPSMLLSKYTKKHVTVALSGDAGDESFIGYHRYLWIKKVIPIFKIPHIGRKALSQLLTLSPNYRHKLIAKGISIDNINDLYLRMFSGLSDQWIKEPSKALSTTYSNWVNTDKPLLERISDFDLKFYLTDDINTKVDRASMAFSLESRSPLQDHRVIQFARSLPTSYKFHNNVTKRILKDVLYDYVPKKIFDRPKMGFGMPVDIWFRTSLKEFVMDTLNEKTLNEIPVINKKEVLSLISEHMTGKANRSPMIWALLVYEMWNKWQSELVV